MKAVMKRDKTTKNMVRFTEVLESELDAPKIGVIYVPKFTLKEIGWSDNSAIVLNIEVEGK